MTYNDAYTRGFVDRLAKLEKSAKALYEMTPEERVEAEKAKAKLKADREAKIPKRKRYSDVSGADKAKSVLKGLGAAAGTVGVRAVENGAEFMLWVPLMYDEYVNGKLLGLDHGRGLYGRMHHKAKRQADRLVDKARTWSSDHDYANRMDDTWIGGANRFLAGAPSDMIGAYAGWGGFNLRKNVLKKILHQTVREEARKSMARKALGKGVQLAFTAPTLFSFSREGQLRDREELIRALPPEYRDYYDPTSTPDNQMHAPTPWEYQRFNLPGTGVPTSVNGVIRVPSSWAHTADGSPTVFRQYGT